jgi:Ca-activated chloride channel family protein
MFSFEHVEFFIGLAALIPLVLLFVFVLRWKRKVRRHMGDEELVNSLTSNFSAKNYSYKFYLQLLAIVLCVVGAANLRTPKNAGGGKRSGIDIMIALDVSNSMLAQDIKPNRLERAKQLLNKLVEKVGDNRMGLVLFAGQAYLQMPLTADLSAAKMYISNASPDAVPMQGTVVGDALRICDASLDTKEKKYKAVILISDGEDHDPKSEEVVKQLHENGVIVYSVGIGSPEGSPIFDAESNDYKKDEAGNVVISKLNEKELQQIAEQTGGSYHLFTSADEVTDQLMAAVDDMEKKQIGTGEQREYTTYFQWFLLAALLLLILEVIIPERKMKWLA